MSTDDILDAIDHALRDVELGADAMRWSPEEPPADARDPTGRHATDVLVGREERPAADVRVQEQAGARYRAAYAMSERVSASAASNRDFARSVGCTCYDTLADVCPHHGGGRDPGLPSDARHLTVDDVARMFDVSADIIRRTFGACACPESGHVPTCVMRAVERRGAPLAGPVTHSDPAPLAEHVERARGRQERSPAANILNPRGTHPTVDEIATEHVRTRQERAQGRSARPGRMEGERETRSVLDEVRAWMRDPHSPLARMEHDFTRVRSACPACARLRSTIARMDSEGRTQTLGTAQGLVDEHGRWMQEHEWVEHGMARARIPMRGTDPLPYYRALWRNAHERRPRQHPDRDVPWCTVDTPIRGATPVLLLGGRSPYDGAVINVSRLDAVLTVTDTSWHEPIHARDFTMNPTVDMPPIPMDTYTNYTFAYRHRLMGREETMHEMVYLCRMTQQEAEPVVAEAIARGLIGPIALARRVGRGRRIY